MNNWSSSQYLRRGASSKSQENSATTALSLSSNWKNDPNIYMLSYDSERAEHENSKHITNYNDLMSIRNQLDAQMRKTNEELIFNLKRERNNY